MLLHSYGHSITRAQNEQQTPGRAQILGVLGPRIWARLGVCRLTCGTPSAITSHSEMLSVSSSCQQPHRQTAHYDVTVAESKRRQTNVTTAADRHASGWGGCVYCYTKYRHTRFDAKMRWYTWYSGLAVTFVTLVTLVLFWLIDWVMKSDRLTTKAASSVNVDESMSAGLPWDFIPRPRDYRNFLHSCSRGYRRISRNLDPDPTGIPRDSLGILPLPLPCNTLLYISARRSLFKGSVSCPNSRSTRNLQAEVCRTSTFRSAVNCKSTDSRTGLRPRCFVPHDVSYVTEQILY